MSSLCMSGQTCSSCTCQHAQHAAPWSSLDRTYVGPSCTPSPNVRLQASSAADSAKGTAKDVSSKAVNAVPDVSLVDDQDIGNAGKKVADKAAGAANDAASTAQDVANDATGKVRHMSHR